MPSNDDIGVAASFPAIEYFPQNVPDGDEVGGIYQETREVAGEFWEVQNASYNSFSNQWLLVDPTKPARAIVSSGIKGEFDFRLSAAGVQPCVFTTQWSITDHGVASMTVAVSSLPANTDMSGLGIYNVLAPQYGAVPNVNTPAQCAANTTAFQTACNDATTNGGMVYIPTGKKSDTYYLNTGITIAGKDVSFAMAGTSDKCNLFVPASSGGGNLFTVTSSGGGPRMLVFCDMRIQYDVPLTGAAFYVSGAQDAQFYRLFFDECPTNIYCDQGLQTQVHACTSQNDTQRNQIAFVLSGTPIAGHASGTQDFFMDACLFRSTAGLGATGILIGECVVFHIAETNISNMDTGISIVSGGAGGCMEGYITDCNLISGYNNPVIQIQPQPDAQGRLGQIVEIKISNTLVRHDHWHGKPFDTIPGILIDTNGGSSNLVTGITLDNVTCDSFGGPGVMISTGQHIKILGGRYSGNALSKQGVLAGITLTTSSPTAAPSDIEINGVSCIGVSGIEPGIQPYGICLGGGAFNVLIADVNVRGNSQAGVVLGSQGPGANVQIVNCPGYNDVGSVLATAFPAGSLGTALTSAQIGVGAGWGTPVLNGATSPYYGIVDSYINTAGAAYKVNGKTTGLTNGTVILYPGGNMTLEIDTSITGYLAVGR